jgi:hypothetical protein
MQVIQFCKLPLYFAGLPDFVLSCDEEEGGTVDFTARLGEADSWEYVRSRVNLCSGQVRFFIGELDVDEDYENYLNAKIDRNSYLQLSDLEHEVRLNNMSDFEIGSNVVNDWSLAKVFNSEWVKNSERQSDRHSANRNYKDRRVVSREHLVLFSKQCYIEFIASDPWEIGIGSVS